MEYFILAVAILILGAILSLIVKEDYKVKLCSLFTFLAGGTILVPAINVLKTGQSYSGYLNFSNLLGKVDFTIDALSAFFIIIIAIMSFLTTIYANGYLKLFAWENKEIDEVISNFSKVCFITLFFLYDFSCFYAWCCSFK